MRTIMILGFLGAMTYIIGTDEMLAPLNGAGDDYASHLNRSETQVAETKTANTRKEIDKDENIATYDLNDAGINAAKAKGRATLPRFFELMAANTPGNYSIKTPLKDNNGNTEHVWVQLTGLDETNFKGLIANEPVIATQYKMGQSITVLRKLLCLKSSPDAG